MNASRLLPIAAAAALALTACEARLVNDAQRAGNGSAENMAEEGQLSISAPGIQMKIDIPEGLRSQANIDDDSGLIYPGSTMRGLHVEGGREKGNSGDEVELRFASTDSADAIARWYQDPARASDFTIATATRQGPAHVFAGVRKNGNGAFRIHLIPRAAGGTDGRVLLSETR